MNTIGIKLLLKVRFVCLHVSKFLCDCLYLNACVGTASVGFVCSFLQSQGFMCYLSYAASQHDLYVMMSTW